jgi:N-acetylmuramoyl-L-alanine amidase
MINPNNITIALDDGHGLETSGKRTPLLPNEQTSEIGLPYMNENLFNRAVVNYLKVELERCGFKTLLIAPTDVDTPLEQRTKLANDKKVNLFVSVHANASAGKWFDGGGIETFGMPTGESKKLADIVHKHVIKGTAFKDRGVKDGSHLWVIRKTNMPSILLELGFMDSNQDYVHLLNDEYRKECAIEICKGICEYYGVAYVEQIVVKSQPKPEKVEDIQGDEELMNLSPALKEYVKAELQDLTDIQRYGKDALSTMWLDKFLKNEMSSWEAVAILYAAKRKGI